MSQIAKPKRIRPFEDYGNAKDTDILTTGRAVEINTFGNTNFPNPPIDAKAFKADNDQFATLLVEAQDGGRTAIAQKNKQREVVIKNLRLVGRYVEVTANGDPATFNTSGFIAASTTRTVQVPLSPRIQSVNHGAVSGQLIVRLKSVPGAFSYELRYAPQTNGTPGAWTTQLVTGLRPPVNLTGLTPGTVYAFQARAMDKAGYSDWSDAVTMMCI